MFEKEFLKPNSPSLLDVFPIKISLYFLNAFMIKINIFKMIKEFTIRTNKDIIEIKYSYTCLQSNHLFKKIIICVNKF